jgi:hypothetical protein
MAQVYVDEQLKGTIRGLSQDEFSSLPEYPLFDGKLDNLRDQEIVPFFGAGASLPSKLPDPPATVSIRPTDQLLSDIYTNLKVSDPAAKRFVVVALQIAQLMDAQARRFAAAASTSEEAAPSSWELANRLALDLELEPFQAHADRLSELLSEPEPHEDYIAMVKSVAELMNLHHAIPQLLTTASYYGSRRERQKLLNILNNRLKGVKTHTQIQQQLVKKAAAYVMARKDNPNLKKRDYLIITTNYDNLLEQQLENAKVPTCVVTIKNSQSHISAHLSNATKVLLGDACPELEQEYVPQLQRPIMSKDYNPQSKSQCIVMVYKLHGWPEQMISKAQDNVVIADRDYVEFIKRNAQTGLIPAFVWTRLSTSKLLFLGYSFADWNIRALYEDIITRRIKATSSTGLGGDGTDYVVIRSYSQADHLFFNRWNDLSVIVADLETVASAI